MRLSHIALSVALMTTWEIPGHAQTVVGEMFASDASVRGSVLFAGGGTQIESGSSVTAGDAAAVLKLRRGGEVRVCPRTSVSVASSPNGRDLLWGMNTGAIEAHFTLAASADTVMTPDFRILLSGPGIFHFAISADTRGNTCVRSLPENSASLIVTELNGDGTYQVRPNVQLVFKNGRVVDPSPLVPPDCGCPVPTIPVLRAEEGKPEPKPAPAQTTIATAATPPPNLPDSASLPLNPSSPEMPHLQMEAPFVYEAGSPEKELDYVAARLRLISGTELPKATVLPPPELAKQSAVTAGPIFATVTKPQQKKGFFGKIGGFFSKIFR